MGARESFTGLQALARLTRVPGLRMYSALELKRKESVTIWSHAEFRQRNNFRIRITSTSYPAWTFARAGSSRAFINFSGRAMPLMGAGEGHVGGESALSTDNNVR